MTDPSSTDRAAVWREEFDASFAEPRVLTDSPRESLLAVRSDQSPFAFRIGELAGLVRCPPLTPMPSRNPAFAGLAGVRGALVGVYSLRALLGAGSASSSGAFIVLAQRDASIAILFDDLLGHEQVREDEIMTTAGTSVAAGHVKEIVSIRSMEHGILSVSSLLQQIGRFGDAGPHEGKEEDR